MTSKRNLVFYVDSELVEKTRELEFNLSKTFENHMKQLLTQYSALNTENNSETIEFGSPGEIRTLVSGSRARHAWPLHHRALHTVRIQVREESLFGYFFFSLSCSSVSAFF